MVVRSIVGLVQIAINAKNKTHKLEFRLSIGYLDDGKIPFKTAKRIGFNYFGIQHNGAFVHLTKCKEFEPK
jgi:hypothetical protein